MPSRVLHAARHAWRMTNPWRPMIRDARGRIMPLYRLERPLTQAAGATDLPSDAFASIRARLLKRFPREMESRPLGLILGAATIVGISVWALTRQRMPGAIIFACAMLGCAALMLLSAWTYRYRVPRARREAIAAALLEEHRCASCAYDLNALPPDPRGLTACPECAATWRLTAPPSSAGRDEATERRPGPGGSGCP